MGEPITFYMDQNVPRAVAEGPRRRGIDVLTAREADMLQATDEQHLAFAFQEGRVIVTQDADVLRFHAMGHTHAGIVYAPQQTSVGTMLRGLMLIHDVLPPEDMAGHVKFLGAL